MEDYEKTKGQFEHYPDTNRSGRRDSKTVLESIPVLIDNISKSGSEDSKRVLREARWRCLMEQSPLPIEILDTKGYIIEFNESWKRLWRMTDSEAIDTLNKYNMLEDTQIKDLGIMDEVRKAFKGERVILPPIQYDSAVTSNEFDIELEEGYLSPWFQCHLFPIKNTAGELVQVVNTYVDITDLKKAEKKAEDRKNMLARLSRASKMGQLAGSISHELNQPLTGILSNAQAAQMMISGTQVSKEEINDILIDIVSDAKRAGDVIRNLRELYKNNSTTTTPTEITSVVEETLKLFQSDLILNNIEIQISKDSDLPMVCINRIQIQQVMVNLINNSIEAMLNFDCPKRSIRINFELGRNKVITSISDSGPGIPEDNLKDIFQPMVTWKKNGTGMGLSISNSIIESHGGKMWAKNCEDGGALVRFSIPTCTQ